MSNRRVIEVPGLEHRNPIPLATCIGSLLVTGPVPGEDPETGEIGVDLETQCALVFANIRRIMEAAGGTTDDVLKLTVWLRDVSDKKAANEEWLKMFPDRSSQPARITLPNPDMTPGYLVMGEILAVLKG